MQLLEATAFLHELTLIHTDLKPENILLASSEYNRTPPVYGSRHVHWLCPALQCSPGLILLAAAAAFALCSSQASVWQ